MSEGSDNALATLVAKLERPVGIADVGCRWGFAEGWRKLGDSVRIVGFDPDTEECAGLRERYVDEPNIGVVDRALASGREERTIHMTAEPACSSFFPPERVVLEQIADLRMIMAPVATTTTETTTLDGWCGETGWGPLDFLKVDVQGAELEVLLGATNTLSNVVVMELEVEFNSLYAGQPLFADVDALARKQDFSLWRLSNLAHYTRDGSPRHPVIPDMHFCDSRPVALDSPGGQLFWAHATYVASDIAEGSGHDWQRSLRAGCVAAVLGLHDLALHAWTLAARLAPEPAGAEIVSVTAEYGNSI